jgi:hypothetical protein
VADLSGTISSLALWSAAGSAAFRAIAKNVFTFSIPTGLHRSGQVDMAAQLKKGKAHFMKPNELKEQKQ